MLLLNKYLSIYRKERLTTTKAKIKVCQDILFKKIASSELKEKITLKGGAVMYQITGKKRTPTKDSDFDVIKMALNLATIDYIVECLNESQDFKKISVSLKKNSIDINDNDDYYSFRFILEFSDRVNTVFELSIDIGVHKFIEIQQETVVFDIMNNGSKVSMKVNPPEQMIIEKTTSILKHGLANSRMRDIYDIFWLINNRVIDQAKLKECVTLIILEQKKAESITNYKEKLVNYYRNKLVLKNLKRTTNWTEEKEEKILENIIKFFDSYL